MNDLVAERRWCLTATPIHNKLEDLGALVRFLKIVPFCGKSPKTAYWRNIIQPLSSGGQDPCSNLRALLRAICLRRTNVGHVNLDTKYKTRNLELSLNERGLYKTILTQIKDDMDQRVSRILSVQTYAKVFTALLKLRRLYSFGTINQSPEGENRTDQATRYIDRSCDFCQKEEFQFKSTEDSFCPNCLRSLITMSAGGLGQPVMQNEYSPSFDAEAHGLCNNVHETETFDAHAAPRLAMEWSSTKLAAVAKELTKNTDGGKRYVESRWNYT